MCLIYMIFLVVDFFSRPCLLRVSVPQTHDGRDSP